MALPTQTFAQYLTNMQNALLNGTLKITNFTSGSIARALSQAVTGVAISLQQLLVSVFGSTRLASSFGNDVDTWVGDFTLTREPLTYATTTITMTRSNAGIELVVQPGGLCQTPGSNVLFQLVPDTNQSSWDPVRNLYYFNPSQYSIAATVQATANFGGSAGNVQAGTITQIVSGMQGVNSIINPLDVINGEDAETDPALKSRFVTFLGSLRSADLLAISKSIQDVAIGGSFQIIEYVHFDGTPFVAGFTIVVDDGTGNAGATFINAVDASADQYRAAGIEFEVFPPTNVLVTVAVHINVITGGSLVAVQNSVIGAVTRYINTLGVGNNVSFVDVANVIQTVPGVFSYSGLLLNGDNNDIPIAQTQLAQAGAVTFN